MSKNAKTLKTVDATKPLVFRITREHCKRARRKDPSNCVVAQAISDTFGDLFESIEVGTNITKVTTPTKVIRYATPKALKEQIPIFDETGKWDLPFDHDYRLAPLPPTLRIGGRPNRWEHKQEREPHEKKPADRFVGRRMPTRKVTRSQMS